MEGLICWADVALTTDEKDGDGDAESAKLWHPVGRDTTEGLWFL